MAITLSHGGTTIYSSPSPSNEVLVGTREGIVTIARENSGAEWQVTHRAIAEKHISAMITEPGSGLIFAGAFHGSVQMSADGGKSWEPRANGMTQTNVYSLAARRIDGRARLFAGTEPAHLFVSDDLGVNWSEMPSLRTVPSVPKWSFPAPPHVGHVKHVNFDPDNPATIYASVEVGGLLKSTDGGQSWQEFPGLYEDVHRLMIHPRIATFLYAVTGRGLYVSPDAGSHWEQWTRREDEIGGYPDGFVFRPRNQADSDDRARTTPPVRGARLILPARGSRATRTAAAPGKSCAMACLTACKQVSKLSVSRRRAAFNDYIGGDHRRRHILLQ